MDARKTFQGSGFGFSLRGPRMLHIESGQSYHRLHSLSCRNGRNTVSKLHGKDPSKPTVRKGWGIKLGRKLRIISLLSPAVKLLRRLRDAYVNMMMAASSKGSLYGLGMANQSLSAGSLLYSGRKNGPSITVDSIDKQYLEVLKKAMQRQRLNLLELRS